MSIEVVAQPSAALHGFFLEAGSGKNKIFETQTLYTNAFHEIKSKHLLLSYSLIKAIDRYKTILNNKLKNSTLTSSEQKQLSHMRSLRFKYFILSAIGKSFEEIAGESIEIRNICFKNGIASSKTNSIDNLISMCENLVKVIVVLLSNALGDRVFSEIMYDREEISSIYNSLTAAIQMQKTMSEENVFSEFSEIIAPRG